MKLYAEAVREWVEKPLGPNANTIFARLRAEAVARGDFDGLD